MNEATVTFALRDGRVVGLDRHLSILRRCGALGDDGLDSVRASLRKLDGDVRAVVRSQGGATSVSRRPLVDVPREVVLAADDVVDLRQQPSVPGADQGWLSQQRSIVSAEGADDALLRISPGLVSQGLASHVVAFADDVAFVSTHERTSPSAYLDCVLDVLRSAGVAVTARSEGLSTALLRANETWVVSAVTGVRRVRAWNEYGNLTPAASLPAESAVPSPAEVDARLWAEAARV